MGGFSVSLACWAIAIREGQSLRAGDRAGRHCIPAPGQWRSNGKSPLRLELELSVPSQGHISIWVAVRSDPTGTSTRGCQAQEPPRGGGKEGRIAGRGSQETARVSSRRRVLGPGHALPICGCSPLVGSQ